MYVNGYCSGVEARATVYNTNEARSLLKRLRPESEEANLLRRALTRTGGIAEISLPYCSYKVDTSARLLVGGFGSSEHVAIGKEVKLKGLADGEPVLMKGITPVRFFDIVALAGDFYGVVGEAISMGGPELEKPARFKRAFESLLEAPNNQVRRVLLEIHQEFESVSNSGLPRHCYSHQLFDKNRAIKKIKGDIDNLLIDNSDHFSVHAKDAYFIGHQYALEVARTAGEAGNLEGLKRAYAIDAFACHFLTDLFSAGHIRNQRGSLEIFLLSIGFSAAQAKSFAGLLTAAQHEKDGHDGLNVQNGHGERWRAYGDGCYWMPKSEKNRNQVINATQCSVDEVYAAYQGSMPSASEMEAWIPNATKCNPLPVYSLSSDKGPLILHRGTDEVEVTNRAVFLAHAISHSLRYLPEDYVTSFIRDKIPIPQVDLPILDKVIVPQVERLTGTIWHLFGLASHRQLKEQKEEISEKINEMADGLRVVTDQNSEILNRLNVIEKKVNEQAEGMLTRDLRKAIVDIDSIIGEAQAYLSTVSSQRLDEMQRKLRNAYLRIASILEKGTLLSGEPLLAVYEQILREREGFEEDDRLYYTTIWFRQMLDYQIKGFKSYCLIQAFRGDDNRVYLEIPIFEKQIDRQIVANSAYIYSDLIYDSINYIQMQLDNSKLKRKAIEIFEKVK